MKRNVILLLLILCTVVAACSKSDIESENSYERSLQAWLSFKKESGNSYQYTVLQSSWTGYRSETTITVTDGKVVRRHFKMVSTEGLENVPEGELEWTEEGSFSEFGTSAAAPIRTLDEIYEIAKTNWLLKRKDSSTTFEAENNGMISLCGFTPRNCVDDCFNGIYITSIIALD